MRLSVFRLVLNPHKPTQQSNRPLALCAGTAGVGCILVGTALIGGGIYYIWQLSDGRRVVADAKGSIFRSEYLEDPEEQPEETVIALNAKSWQAAQRECAWHFYGQKLKVFQRKGRWYCTNKVD